MKPWGRAPRSTQELSPLRGLPTGPGCLTARSATQLDKIDKPVPGVDRRDCHLTSVVSASSGASHGQRERVAIELQPLDGRE